MPQKVDEERLGALLTPLALRTLAQTDFGHVRPVRGHETQGHRHRLATMVRTATSPQRFQCYQWVPRTCPDQRPIDHVVSEAFTFSTCGSSNLVGYRDSMMKLPLAMKACKPLPFSLHVALCKAASLQHCACETHGRLHRSMKLLCRRRPRVHSTVACWGTRQQKPLRFLPVVREPNELFFLANARLQ